jgi:hypothetical protein
LGTYGYLGPTSQPANAIADLVAANDRYHDNVLTIQNNSAAYGTNDVNKNMTCVITSGSAVVTGCPQTTGAIVGNFLSGAGITPGTTIASGLTATGFTMSANATQSGGVLSILQQCGNAAVRFRGPLTGISATQNYERAAVGYSATSDGCQGFFPNTLYAEIGNIAGAADPNDTSFLLVSTHAASATNFPGTSYAGYKFDGATGDHTWKDHTGASMLSILDATGIVTASKGMTVNGTALTNSNKLAVYGTSAFHADCTGQNTAGAMVITAECNSGTNGIRYTFSGSGATVMGYNGGGTLNTDGSSIKLATGNATPGSGTAVATLSSATALFPGTVNAVGGLLNNGLAVSAAGANSLTGVSQIAPGTIYISTADATMATTSDVSCFGTGSGTQTIPANSVAVGTRFSLSCLGNYTTPAASTAFLTMKLKWGGTTVVNLTTGAMPAPTTKGLFRMQADCTIRSIGASGSIICNGHELNIDALIGANSLTADFSATAPVTVATNASALLDMTIAWSAVTSTQSITSNQSYIGVVN